MFPVVQSHVHGNKNVPARGLVPSSTTMCMSAPSVDGVVSTAIVNRKEWAPFICHECQRPMKDLGYWNGAAGRREVLYRCVNTNCAQCAVSRAPVNTTFAARNWI